MSIHSYLKMGFLYFFSLLVIAPAYAQNVTFSSIPAHLQLYARNSQDSAVVRIAGKVNEAGFDTVSLKIYRNTQIWKEQSQPLTYSGNAADFEFLPKIVAGLYEYRFEISVDQNLVAIRDSIACGDVYLINGQSNSHPNATSYSYRNEFCRSFGQHTNYEDYDPADTTWGLSTPEGWCDSCDYAVGVWGLRLQQMILEDYGIPTCVINGGSGGSSISYNLPNENDHMDLTTTYGRLLYRATKAKVADKVKALFWHQGESDSWNDDTDLYFDRFSQLYAAWNEDYAPLDIVYVFQLHPGSCGGDAQDRLRDIQRRFPESFSKVEMMSTVGLDGHDGCHYNDDGYLQMAEWVYGLVKRDFYDDTDTLYVAPPDVLDVYFTDANQNQVAVQFDQPVVWPADTLGAAMEEYFYLDGNSSNIDTGYTDNNDASIVYLDLLSNSNAAKLTYLPNHSYNGKPLQVYQGPWIRNERGIGALSFYEVTVRGFVSAIENVTPTEFFLEQNYPNPFNPETVISYQLPALSKVEGSVFSQVNLRVYNVLGQKIRTLVNEKQPAGKYSIKFDGRDLPGGIYFYRLKAGNRVLVRKALLLK